MQLWHADAPPPPVARPRADPEEPTRLRLENPERRAESTLTLPRFDLDE